MYTHAPRITRSYDDISGGLAEWFNRCSHALVVQHEPDEGCSKTHEHIGLWGCEVQAEQLKRDFNKVTKLKLSGNKDWAWDHKDFPGGLPAYEEPPIIDGVVTPGNTAQEQTWKYIRYCIKGDLDHVKCSKNISPALMEAAAADWAVRTKERNQPDVIHIIEKRNRPPPYQQLVIADAAERWYAYKREATEKDELINETEVVEYVCDAMRKQSKGINPHMVRDLSYAVLYDDLEFKSVILAKCKKFF